MTGVAQVGGPPVVLYWLGGATKAAVVRANIVLYFAVSATLAFIVYALAGILTTASLGLALLIAPVYGLALYAGSHMFGFASERMYRGICYALIAGPAW